MQAAPDTVIEFAFNFCKKKKNEIMIKITCYKAI